MFYRSQKYLIRLSTHKRHDLFCKAEILKFVDFSRKQMGENKKYPLKWFPSKFRSGKQHFWSQHIKNVGKSEITTLYPKMLSLFFQMRILQTSFLTNRSKMLYVKFDSFMEISTKQYSILHQIYPAPTFGEFF